MGSFSYSSIDSLKSTFRVDDSIDHSLAFIDPGFYPTGDALINTCEQIGLPELQADYVVLRGEGEQFLEMVNNNSRLRRLVSSEQNVLVLASGIENGNEGPRLYVPSWADTSTQLALPDLRRIEITGTLDTYGAILNASDRHYVLPGGGHAGEYIRLRSAFERALPARRLAEWIMPEVPRDGTVFFAHRGLGATMTAVEWFAKRRHGWDVKAVELPPYKLFRTLDPHVAQGLTNESPDLIVIGVDYQRARSKALASRGFAEVPTVCLIDISTEMTTPSFLHHPIPQLLPDDEGNCSECRASPDLQREVIDPDTEERKSFTPPFALRITSEYVRPFKDFWQAVERSRALRLHTDDSYPHRAPKRWTLPTRRPAPIMRRHRMVDVSVRLLLKDDEFRSKCLADLSNMPMGRTPDLVLIPKHRDAKAIEDLIGEAFGTSSSQISYIDRHDPQIKAADGLGPGSEVLLADDMAVTGGTLYSIDSALRETLGDDRFRRLKRFAFVVINAIAEEDLQRKLKNRFQDGPGVRGFRASYDVPLPSPETECAWCREMKRWEDVSNLVTTSSDFVIDRLDALDDRATFDEISILSKSDETIVDSVIGDVGVDVAFAAWSSATTLALSKSGLSSGEKSGYVDLAWALVNWDNGAQLSGILRTCPEGFVRHRENEAGLIQAIGELEWAPPEKFAEVGWAAIDEKLTPGSLDAILGSIRAREDHDPAFKALSHLLKIRLGEL